MVINDKFKYSIQFILTIAISLFFTDTVLKSIALVFFWLISFYPLKRKEIYFFFIVNFVFILSNYGALASSNFIFFKKDILLMPYNELIMWGFYCLNAHRLIGLAKNKNVNKTLLFSYAFIFAVSFSVIRSEVVLATTLFLILSLAFYKYRSKRNLYFLGYFILMGFIVEASGLYFDLWMYPRAEYFKFPIWAPLMWANIGLIMSEFSIVLL